MEDEDMDDYYTPRPARASRDSSRRTTYQGNQFYTPYYEERDEDKNFPLQDPPRRNDDNQKLAPYSSQSNFDDDDDEDYDEWDDEAYYDEEEEDFRETDDEESTTLGGNFWSNPKGGIDRSMRPPTQTTPRLTRPRRRPVEPNSKRRRRTPVRSNGMTQAPLVAKDFYERLFWYGFDPDESEQIGDKTVFGGTKGKFNGLAFLQASEVPRRPVRSRIEKQQQEQQRRPLPPSRQTRRTADDNDDEEDQNDYYYDDDDDDDDDEEEDDYNFVDGRGKGPNPRGNRRMTSTRTNVTPPADGPNPRNERRAIPPPQRRRKPQRPRKDDFYEMDEEEESFNGGDWISKQVSSWFSGAEGEDEDDDDYNDDDYRGDGRSTGRQQRSRQRTGKSEWSPFNILDAFLGVNRDELAYKAEMYNSKMGIGPKRRSPRPTADVSQRERRQQTRGNSRRRPGYAYRYNAEEEMDEEEGAFVVDVEPVTRQDSKSLEGTTANGYKDEKAKDEVEDEPSSSNSRIKDLTWEERALAVERVPPADIPGWGPSGELPYDARTKAIMDALEDIQTARQKVEACEKKEALAKEEITILKVDAELQRRQLEESRTNVRLAQERLRQIELEIDDASRALRRARTRVRLARDRLEELQVRHWAVLGFYNPDQAEEKVAEALAAYRLSDSMGNPLGDLNTVAQPTSTTTSEVPPSADNLPIDITNTK